MNTSLQTWWEKGLKSRERRALLVLAIVGPMVVLWWGVTRPLLDQRESLRRATAVLAKQYRELEEVVRRVEEAREKMGVARGGKNVSLLPFLEKSLQIISGSSTRTLLQPSEIRAGNAVLEGATLQFREEDAHLVYRRLFRLASEGMVIQTMELSRSPDGRAINGTVTVRRP